MDDSQIYRLMTQSGCGGTLTPAVRRFAAACAAAETARWEAAMRLAWQMVDPLNPAGTPGSYARGQDTGIVAALTTLRASLRPSNAKVTGHTMRPEDAAPAGIPPVDRTVGRLAPEREAFEAWKLKQGEHYMSLNNAPGSDLNGYQDAYTQGQWEAWQAAMAAERERCARVCEQPVEVLRLPDEPRYDGDDRPIVKRAALGLAEAIRRGPNVKVSG